MVGTFRTGKSVEGGRARTKKIRAASLGGSNLGSASVSRLDSIGLSGGSLDSVSACSAPPDLREELSLCR